MQPQPIPAQLAQPMPPALPPSIKIVPEIPEHVSGAQIDIPEEIVELFRTRADSNIRLLDANSKKLIEIVPADGTTRTLSVTADPGTVLEFQAFADGDLVGTAFVTADN